MRGCCCIPAGCEIFDERAARRDLRRYRQKGLDPTAGRIVEFLRERELEGASVLEVGGGIGALQLELLRAGAARVTNVELSPAYEQVASELLEDGGFAGRAVRLVHDFADGAAEVEAADAVVLHRVVCCYPDGEALVRGAAEKAGRLVVLSLPRDVWWTRLVISLQNAWHRLRGRRFRVFVHPPGALLAVARSRGFEPVLDQRGPIWQLVALEAIERTPASRDDRVGTAKEQSS